MQYFEKAWVHAAKKKSLFSIFLFSSSLFLLFLSFQQIKRQSTAVPMVIDFVVTDQEGRVRPGARILVQGQECIVNTFGHCSLNLTLDRQMTDIQIELYENQQNNFIPVQLSPRELLSHFRKNQFVLKRNLHLII